MLRLQNFMRHKTLTLPAILNTGTQRFVCYMPKDNGCIPVKILLPDFDSLKQSSQASMRSSFANRQAGTIFRCGLVEDLAQTGELFDGVVASEVIEHVADPDTFIACCANLVNVGSPEIKI